MPDLRNPRVLVVDDERTFTDVVAEALEDEGFEVLRAYDGQQALRLLRNGDLPDVVLSDLMMPFLTGTQLLEEVRRLYPRRRVPFILLSAGADPTLRPDGVLFFSKPLQLDHLVEQVWDLVRPSGEGEARPSTIGR